jgi:hypothetical protein
MQMEHIINHIRNRPYMSGVDRTEQRKKALQEVFTTENIIKEGFDELDQSYFSDSEQPIIDPCVGDGNLLGEALIRRIENGVDFETALSQMYGCDIEESNVIACRNRLLCGRDDLRHIVEKNIIVHDALTYDFSFNGTNFSESEIARNSIFDFRD